MGDVLKKFRPSIVEEERQPALLTFSRKAGHPLVSSRGEKRECEAKEGRPMSATSTVQEMNRELARQINAEARSNPQSPYANKFVGIANGQVVVVADDLDEVVRRLRQIEPDPRNCFFVEASRDYSEVHEIWGLS
jgi:hypothetical protein